MQKPRILPRIDIKKGFLKVLYNELAKGKTPDFRYILIKKVPAYFCRKPLSKEEFQFYKYIIGELYRDGYIELGPNRKYVYQLTPKGLNEAGKEFDDMRLPLFDISSLYLRPNLYKKIYQYYKNGDFETAIFKAFKLLEEKVRTKANLPPSDNVARLMSDAFKSDGGRLKYPYAKTEGEQNGIQNLMRGSIMFFKSPRSHRTVITDNPNRVMFIFAFAHLLLEIVDECELTDSNQKK